MRRTPAADRYALDPEGHPANVARDSVVDESALVAAVEAGRIAGAALDVFADEPNAPRALPDSDRVTPAPPHRRRHRGDPRGHGRPGAAHRGAVHDRRGPAHPGTGSAH
ncbi:NAD(P)-dependent oxidoreductase [Streptomyces sp. NPDC057236]|uniref:NAD(P)-dependent oxidoreductase n=1 Tax=Streptomyces sp. NPDC057236 TaxID=3346059 RepID=UPI00363E0CD9